MTTQQNIDDYNKFIAILKDTGKFVEWEKQVIYFIMSHSCDVDGAGRNFLWPILPDPSMGAAFVEKIKKEHAFIAIWMRENRYRTRRAVLGYYTIQ